jgi:hypothetical protein
LGKNLVFGGIGVDGDDFGTGHGSEIDVRRIEISKGGTVDGFVVFVPIVLGVDADDDVFDGQWSAKG